MWMKKMLKDIKIEFEDFFIIYCDNTSTMCMSKNRVFHSKTKHISIKYHVMKEKIEEKEIILEYMSTKDHIADIFMKCFP